MVFGANSDRVRLLMKLLIAATSTVGSAVGWWLGESFGLMTAFLLSIIGLGVGIWGGRQIGARWGLD